MTAPNRPHPGAAALAAARRGWRVFPLTPGGKTPVAGFTGWERNATTDPARIRSFWSRGRFNVGIACGPSGLVVVDLDVPKPGQRPPAEWADSGVVNGDDVFAGLCQQAGQPFPFETFTVHTRRGGTHLYFAAPPGVQLRNTSGGGSARGLGWLVDTRAHGGYVVAPGSFVDLPDGTGSYDVVHNVPPAPLPGWLADRLSTPVTARPDAPPSGVPTGPGESIKDPSGYLRAALQGETQRVRAAVPGTRNHTLNKAAYHLGRLVGAHALTYDTAYAALWDAARVHLGPGHHDVAPDEAHATITSGLTAGTRNPRTITSAMTRGDAE